MARIAAALAPGPLERATRNAVTVYVLALVALPLLALVHAGFSQGLREFFAAFEAPVAREALWLTAWTGLLVGAIDLVLGTASAWVLVRYRFPGRQVISALVDLPFAVPTLVAGVMIGVLYGRNSWTGTTFERFGIEIMFAPPAIVLSLLFVTLPFVIRAVEPVLLEIDPAEEEAARVLGAGPLRIFRSVYLPAIMPAALSGAIRALGRALGEFGSVVVVAGNIPWKTLTAPVYVFGEIESGAPLSAAAISLLMLAAALLLHAAARVIEERAGVSRA
jgi:sulfate/thiosulfate transport system permease protein